MADSYRKPNVRLTAEEEYGVYKYAVENHCLSQTADMYSFRVQPSIIAQEINKHFPKITNNREISVNHVRSAVDNVIGWQKLLSKLPVVPIETAELEQLREGKLKMIKEIEELKVLHSNNAHTILQLRAEIERLKNSGAQSKIDRIRAIVSA